MSALIIRKMTSNEAHTELRALVDHLPETLQDFEERANRYDLSPEEQGIWEKITELRWLLRNE